ncbi:ADP-ribosylhydrolase ARH3 isoform X1 [Macaca fascicularis]|uniref:ADP-ribosylhydrolase ARH3 isoform X1 n=1 Tax=Macaca fascicularis TaxID=9541 RepID=UPI001E2544A0|nr:ADP-ribose glycohydrolase ARH3 isoform X2 [Macaca fascicularis]
MSRAWSRTPARPGVSGQVGGAGRTSEAVLVGDRRGAEPPGATGRGCVGMRLSRASGPEPDDPQTAWAQRVLARSPALDVSPRTSRARGVAAPGPQPCRVWINPSFAQEYKKDPDRGYGAGVVTVFKKLLNPKCRDVFEPARAQFNGKGSYGNGGAMRVAGISLAYSSVQDVQKFARLSAQLTHASSLGYNGAILQALAVHLALQGESSSKHFLKQLLGHMEELEGDAQSVLDARELGMEEHPYSSRLKKIGELLDQASVTREEVVSELGNGIAAFESVPTAIYCFLRCMEPDPEIPSAFNSLQRTLIYSISLGGDTDTIATMAGAIAGAYYGMDQVPESWQQSCEGYEETDILAQSLHRVFQKSL